MAQNAKQQQTESSSGSSLLNLVLLVVVFVAAVIAIKFIFGVAMTILKWAIIGAVALGVTWFVMKKMGGSKK